MAEVIELKDFAGDPEKLEIEIAKVVESLRSGGIIVAAIESAYIYACDAFDRDAVSRLHTLRGDDFGVACQVMIGSFETLDGIAQNVTEDLTLLTKKFWPGLLTLHVAPTYGLSWDLGDAGELGEFAVRIPNRELFRAVLEKSGPLAVASAALVGRPPILDIGQISALYSDISYYLDEGVLTSGPASTIVQQISIGTDLGLEVLRVGAITLEALQEVLPNISVISA